MEGFKIDPKTFLGLAMPDPYRNEGGLSPPPPPPPPQKKAYSDFFCCGDCQLFTMDKFPFR